MKGQKKAVVDQVMAMLPAFVQGQDIALIKLSTFQLENIKNEITRGIVRGEIEYGKDPKNVAEVRTYARSMVMNHLKKAKELNGGQGSSSSPADKPAKSGGIDFSILPQDLKDYLSTL